MAATRPPCFPDLDGLTKVDLPSEMLLGASWDVEILDPEDEPSHKIIDAGEPFTVGFRLQLTGLLWDCVCGDWCFDLGFTPIGKGTGFDLSDLLGEDALNVKDWKGCETKCIERVVTVPANTIPVEHCGDIVFETGGRFQLHCCGRPAGVVGFKALEEFQFFRTDITD